MICETALSLLLVAAAGLLLRSFAQILKVDPGFRPDGVLTLRVALPDAVYSKPEQVRGLLQRVTRSRATIAGRSVRWSSFRPALERPGRLRHHHDRFSIRAPGRYHAGSGPARRRLGLFQGDGHFFGPWPLLRRARLRHGAAGDHRRRKPRPDLLAQPGSDRQAAASGRPSAQSPWATVIGVVRHVRNRTLEARSRVEVYWPENQRPSRSHDPRGSDFRKPDESRTDHPAGSERHRSRLACLSRSHHDRGDGRFAAAPTSGIDSARESSRAWPCCWPRLEFTASCPMGSLSVRRRSVCAWRWEPTAAR